MTLTAWIRKNGEINRLRSSIERRLKSDSDALRRASLSQFIRDLEANPDLDLEQWIEQFILEFHLPAAKQQQLRASLTSGQGRIATWRTQLYREVGVMAAAVDATMLQAAYAVDFPRIANDVRQVVTRQARRVIALGGDSRQMAAILRQGEVVAYQAKTLSNTALAQFSNAHTRQIAKEAGINTYRYIGPPAERPFCQDLLASGRDYTEQEIAVMDNGQGLDVMTSCGGYNCQHSWILVPEGVE